MKHLHTPREPLLQGSPRPVPRPDLAAQIIRQALAQPQQQGWLPRWQRLLEELGYAWPYKLASLALCAALGVFAGQWQDSSDTTELLLSAQMLDSALGTEEP
ncbi:hypothetical protein [Pseudomonas sp. N040]|uniref:hypothetical protein n=1 Tax=Pseudomonas sp. N040 TaxID=2785325 RepID=UPI0018A3144C|nr:hypothetical protein [Pseudomonas sp. N040]MBF7731075.1 hypothetical protein [Pseudomonas sp. N040]MBW7014718.1 hypothetical protein [Pseudomonas sp. N040]